MQSKKVRVTLLDCRASGCFCVEGGKAFFEKHGLDWKQFIRDGIDADELAKCNDAMASKIIEVAYGRQQ